MRSGCKTYVGHDTELCGHNTDKINICWYPLRVSVAYHTAKVKNQPVKRILVFVNDRKEGAYLHAMMGCSARG